MFSLTPRSTLMLSWLVVALLLVPHPGSAPLRALLLAIHELSHAAIAMATGGEVLEIAWFADESGHTRTRGGYAVLILLAGYPSTLLLGVLLSLFPRSPWVFPLAGGVLWASPDPAGIGTAALVLLGGWRPRWALTTLGRFAVAFYLWDVLLDTLLRSTASDATLLAEITHIPGRLWGLGWLALGVAFSVALRGQLFVSTAASSSRSATSKR